MPKCIFLRGIPCSGKSTYATKMKKLYGYFTISRDEIRQYIHPGKYIFNSRKERQVSTLFNNILDTETSCGSNIIIDNTNINPKYISDIKKRIPLDYEIEIKDFPISLTTAYIRNVLRWLNTGKWIPFSVIKRFKTQYDSL